MREVELVLNGVLGHEPWGIDVYVNSSGELKLLVTNDDGIGEAKLDKVQALALSETLREYYDGQTEDTSAG